MPLVAISVKAALTAPDTCGALEVSTEGAAFAVAGVALAVVVPAAWALAVARDASVCRSCSC